MLSFKYDVSLLTNLSYEHFRCTNKPFSQGICSGGSSQQVYSLHLQTNRMGETLHRTLGAMLRKACASKLDWATQGPFAMLALRAAPNRDTGLSPYELVYGNTTAKLVPSHED